MFIFLLKEAMTAGENKKRLIQLHTQKHTQTHTRCYLLFFFFFGSLCIGGGEGGRKEVYILPLCCGASPLRLVQGCIEEVAAGGGVRVEKKVGKEGG